MSEEARKLAHGARRQWDTVAKLMQLSRTDPETCRSVRQHAQAARRVVADQRSSSPSPDGSMADLSSAIDTVIQASNESSAA